jgi:hypothetical protein
MSNEVERETGSGTSLWKVIASPTIWAVHLLVCYIAGAIYCEKTGREAGLAPAQWIVGITTLVALAGIGLVVRSIWTEYRRSVSNDDFDFEVNSAEERHRFLSHVTLMLSILAVAAILYATIPAIVLETCR